MSRERRPDDNDTFRSFRTRSFRLFISGQAVSQVGTWLTKIAMTLLVLDRTHSGFAVGMLTFCQFGPVLLCAAWAGLIADRSDKRRLLMIVQSAAMAQSFLLAILAFAHGAPLISFYAVALVGGLALAFDHPTRQSYVAELVPERDVPNAVALNTAVMTSAKIIGPAIAGALITTVGYGWCFLLDGVSYLAVLYGLWRIDSRQTRPSPVTLRGRGQVREGLRYVRQVSVLWISLVIMAIVGTLTFNFQVVFPLLVRESLGGNNTSFTVLFSMTGIGSVFGALSTARRKTIGLRHLALTTTAFGFTMFALALAPNLAVAYGVSILVGLTSIAFLATAMSIIQLQANPSMRGRVLAIQAVVLLGSTPVGGPVLGVICDTFGARVGVMVGAAAALAAGGWGAFMAGRTPTPVGADDRAAAVAEFAALP